MVLHVMKWNVRPEKKKEYYDWTKSAIERTLGVPGVVEFRAYRPATGEHQIVVTYEFADFAAWASFYENEVTQEVLEELRALTHGFTREIWGPSPVVPQPIRPGG